MYFKETNISYTLYVERSSFLWMFSLLLKDLISDFYLTSLQLVLCRVAAVKRLPYINHSAVYILFWSFEISDNILRNQKQMIG